MLIEHRHRPGVFDRVQREEDSLRATQRWASQAHRNATWASVGLGHRAVAGRHLPAHRLSCLMNLTQLYPGAPHPEFGRYR